MHGTKKLNYNGQNNISRLDLPRAERRAAEATVTRKNRDFAFLSMG